MKTMIMILLTPICLTAYAKTGEPTLQCTRNSTSSCSARTIAALQMLGCSPDLQAVHCHDAATDPMADPSAVNELRGKDFCKARSLCESPNIGNFGQVACDADEQSVNLANVDSGITLDVTVGFPRHYVTVLCK